MRVSIDLTHPIHEEMPVYPGSKQPALLTGSTIEQNGFSEKRISFDTHTGTHMDAPAHLVKGGSHLGDYDISRFHGNAVVAHLGAVENKTIDLGTLTPFGNQLKTADFLLIHTGWSRYWGRSRYFSGFPTLSMEAAEWVAGKGLKGIGFDLVSADPIDTRTYPVHKILLTSDMVIVENLTNLDKLPEGPLEFSCFPLPIHQADGSPVRAVAFFTEARGG